MDLGCSNLSLLFSSLKAVDSDSFECLKDFVIVASLFFGYELAKSCLETSSYFQ